MPASFPELFNWTQILERKSPSTLFLLNISIEKS